MKEVIAEICFDADEVKLKVLHHDDGTRAGFVTVICKNLVDRDKVSELICRDMKYLQLTSKPKGDEHLCYYDTKNLYDTLGIDVDYVFDFSDLDENKPFFVEFLRLIETHLEEPEVL